jgi:hypothetical protein
LTTVAADCQESDYFKKILTCRAATGSPGRPVTAEAIQQGSEIVLGAGRYNLAPDTVEGCAFGTAAPGIAPPN